MCDSSAMVVKYRVRDKEKRNQRIVQFKEKHPDYTHDAIAKIFHIDRSRVTRILQRAEMKGEEDQECQKLGRLERRKR